VSFVNQNPNEIGVSSGQLAWNKKFQSVGSVVTVKSRASRGHCLWMGATSSSKFAPKGTSFFTTWWGFRSLHQWWAGSISTFLLPLPKDVRNRPGFECMSYAHMYIYTYVYTYLYLQCKYIYIYIYMYIHIISYWCLKMQVKNVDGWSSCSWNDLKTSTVFPASGRRQRFKRWIPSLGHRLAVQLEIIPVYHLPPLELLKEWYRFLDWSVSSCFLLRWLFVLN
jgi:hypothetical protein